jgi:predicted CoA-substrate-specific enzyme activase
MSYLGIDIGSLSCDGVLLGEDGQVLATAVTPTGARNQEAVARVKEMLFARSGILDKDVQGTISTGYGREKVPGRSAAVTEITCHARGIKALFPGVSLVIDIGGQDSKIIRLSRDGRVEDFAMNDKCAAGTGRFLEAMARALEVDILELGEMDRDAVKDLTLSSVCTVFAESEVVSLLANGEEVREIVRGLNRSIASRTMALVKRVVQDHTGMTVAMSGGVGYNRGVVRSLAAALGTEILVPEQPDLVGALGAALIARERAEPSS